MLQPFFGKNPSLHLEQNSANISALENSWYDINAIWGHKDFVSLGSNCNNPLRRG